MVMKMTTWLIQPHYDHLVCIEENTAYYKCALSELYRETLLLISMTHIHS